MVFNTEVFQEVGLYGDTWRYDTKMDVGKRMHEVANWNERNQSKIH